MQISLNQTEIETAVVNYIAEQGITIAYKDITVTFSAGRGENRLTADINIKPMGDILTSPAALAEVEKTASQYIPVPAPELVEALAETEEDKPVKAAAKTVGGLFS